MSVSTSHRWFVQLISAINEIWSRKIVIVCRPFKKEITDVSIFCFIIIISSLRKMTSLRGKIPSLDITDNFLTYFLMSKPKWGKSFYGCYQGSAISLITAVCVLLRRDIHLLQSQIAYKKKETNSEWCRRQISVQVEHRWNNFYNHYTSLFGVWSSKGINFHVSS